MKTFPVLMYHNIDDAPLGVASRGLYVRPTSFRYQMALLKYFGYTGLSMGELMPYLRGKKKGRVCGITFDDGYVDNVDVALPILHRYGHQATCYVVSNRVGRYNSWDSDRQEIRKSIMQREHMQLWLDAGMEIGAHTRNHIRLPQISNDCELADEISGSKNQLEDMLSYPVTQFCYPWGEYDERVVKATNDAGFEAATTTIERRAHLNVNLLEIPRIAIKRHHWLHVFLMKVASSYGDRC